MAGTLVGEIYVEIRAKLDRLQSDMDAGTGKVKSAAKAIQNTADTITGYLASLGVGAFAGYIKGAIDAGGALADLSQKTGISASELSALEYAAKMSGTSVDGIATGLRGLSKNMVAAADGSKEAKDGFKALGISVTDSNGRLKTSQQVMLEVADKFKGMDDGAQKSAAAMQIFGKSGADLIPLLNEGADGIKEMTDTAAQLGLVLSDDTAAAMESLGDKFDTVQMAGGGLARQFASNITPALVTLADMFVEGAKQGSALQSAVGVLGDAFRILVSIALGVVATFQMAGTVIGAVGTSLYALANGDVKGAKEAFTGLGDKLGEIANYYDTKLKGVWADTAKAQQDVAAKTREHATANEELSKQQEAAAKKAQGVIDKLRDEVTALGMTSLEAEIYKKQKEAGVTANSRQGQQIADLVRQLDAEKGALAKVTEKLHEEALTLNMTALEAEIYKKQKEAGVAASSKEGQAIARLVTEIEMEKAAKKAAKEADEAAAKAARDLIKERERELATVSQAIANETWRIKTLGMTKVQVEELTLAEMQNRLELIRKDPALAAEVAHLEQRITKQKELVDVLKKGEAADATIKQAEESKKAWDDTSKAIEQALTDSLMRGFDSGKGFIDSLVDYIKNAFKTNVVKMLVQPVMGGINAIFSPGAMASGGAGGDPTGGLGGMFSSAKGIFDTFSSGFANVGAKLTQYSTQLGSYLSQQGFSGAGSFLTGNAGTIGTIGAYGAGIGAGYGIGTAIAGQYEVGGVKGSTTAAIGTAIGAAVGGPLGAAIGGAIGGAINRAFGRKPKEVTEFGIQGTIGGGDFNGQSYSEWVRKGGWFRSDKRGTDFSALPSEVESLLNQGAAAVLASVKGMAESLELPVVQMDKLTMAVRTKLTGNLEEDNAAIAKLLDDYTNTLAGSVSGYLTPLQRAGETLAETLSRVANVQMNREVLNTFGGVFSKIAASGIDATEAMVALAGGLDALVGKANAFVQAYYTQDEQAGLQARGIIDALKATGLDAGNLTTRDGFRALVESMDASTATGREQLNALLTLAPDFANLSQYLADSGKTLAQVATLAPAMAVLDPLFTQQTAAQQTAQQSIQQTTAAVLTVADLIRQGNGDTLQALTNLGNLIANTVASVNNASIDAINTLNGKLDRMESNTRLESSR